MEDLIAFEDKLEELCLFSYRQEGSKGREGEYYTDIRNFYSDLFRNRNFMISDEIHEYLKLKKIICFEVYDSNANSKHFNSKFDELCDVITAKLRVEHGLEGTSSISPSIKLPKELLFEYEKDMLFPDNFQLSSYYTLKNIDEFLKIKKSSLLRPFTKQILDDNFTKGLLSRLDRRGLSNEKWFIELSNTQENV